MSYETKILVSMFAGAIALAALLLWTWDFLYTRTTGKPASERVRERLEGSKRAMSPGAYRTLLSIALLGIVLFAYMAIYSPDYRGWARGLPLALLCSFGVGAYDLWRRQRAGEQNSSDQLSGGAT